MGKLKMILTFEGVEERKEAKHLEILKEGIATLDRRRTSSQGKRRMVVILYGESAKSREPSDLTKEYGRFCEYS
jgi:hypothetical protein